MTSINNFLNTFFRIAISDFSQEELMSFWLLNHK